MNVNGDGFAAATAAPTEVERPPFAQLLRARRPGATTPPRAENMTTRPGGKALRGREADEHRFAGTVSVSAGPFDDLDRIGRFAELLGSLPGVGTVRIQTFDRRQVVFGVDIAEPAALLGALRDRSASGLRLLYANDRIIRLKLT